MNPPSGASFRENQPKDWLDAAGGLPTAGQEPSPRGIRFVNSPAQVFTAFHSERWMPLATALPHRSRRLAELSGADPTPLASGHLVVQRGEESALGAASLEDRILLL